MLARVFAIAAACTPNFFVFPAKAQAETNIVTCVLEREGSDFSGTCEVPCSINALAIDEEADRIYVEARGLYAVEEYHTSQSTRQFDSHQYI